MTERGQGEQGKVTVVTGVIGGDAHVVGLRIIEHSLRQAGFNVASLGPMVSQEEFIQAATETDAKAILVSSLYGHAELDCRGFRQKCDEAGLKDIILYIGGNLVVGKHEWNTAEKIFKDLGFNRVYSPDTPPARAIADLKGDLGLE